MESSTQYRIWILLSEEHALFREAAAGAGIVLVDVGPGDHGSEALLRARARGLGGPVVVVERGLSGREKQVLLRHGAAAVVGKSSPAGVLLEGLGRLAAVPQAAAAVPAPRRRLPLTRREREVLRAVFDGCSNKEIAGRLNLSLTSVKAALQQLFAKSGVRSRAQLVRAALAQYADQL